LIECAQSPCIVAYFEHPPLNGLSSQVCSLSSNESNLCCTSLLTPWILNLRLVEMKFQNIPLPPINIPIVDHTFPGKPSRWLPPHKHLDSIYHVSLKPSLYYYSCYYITPSCHLVNVVSSSNVHNLISFIMLTANGAVEHQGIYKERKTKQL